MLRFEADDFYRVLAHISSIEGIARHLRDQKAGEKDWTKILLSAGDLATLRRFLGEMLPHLQLLNARVTALCVNEVLLESEDKEDPITYGRVGEVLSDVRASIRRELSLNTIYLIESNPRRLFGTEDLSFSEDSVSKFPSSAFEIQEMGRCLLFGQSTGAVFHAMRLMEIALNAIRACLGISPPTKDYERNWGAMLRSIKNAMDAKKGHWKKNDKELFDSLYASLDAIRVAWRNTTMHVENKYTAEEAEHIIVAVRGLMNQLSSRCDEQGQPLA